jgi:hypothetical protein
MTYANLIIIPTEEHNRYKTCITTYPLSGACAFNTAWTKLHTLRERIHVFRKRPQNIPRSPRPRCVVMTSRTIDTMISLGFPIIQKVQITINLGGFETHWSGFKSKEMTPATLAPWILWLSTKLQLDWPHQEGLLLPAKSKNSSKCTEKKPNHRKNSIQLMNGVPQPKNRCPVLDRTKLSKTHP